MKSVQEYTLSRGFNVPQQTEFFRNKSWTLTGFRYHFDSSVSRTSSCRSLSESFKKYYYFFIEISKCLLKIVQIKK